MRLARTQSLAAFLAVALAVAAACDDPNEPPPAQGSIEVVVIATGPDVITDDLQVTVGTALVRPLDSGLNTLIAGLEPGVYTVTLAGTSANCQITSTNPRSVTVESNRITVITFTVVCTARTGSVRVTTTTTGSGLDPDGYTATVIDGPSQPVGTHASVTIANVREGQRFVTLTGVAPNCAIAGADTSTVTVPLNGTVDVSFSLACVAFGNLEVGVSTSGVALDADGYSVDVTAASVGFAGTMSVEPNGSVTFTQLRPAADYRVTLRQLASNCDIAGEGVVTVVVVEGTTTSVDIAVVCHAPLLLAVVRDSDIYTIQSDGSGATRLTTDPGFDGEPAWSSSGRIAFTTRRHSDDIELYVMNDDGTNPMRLTTSFGPDDAPSWSPDGQRIVFRSLRDVNSEIYTVNPDGSGLTRLTNNDAADVQPAWSSTGKIAFISDRDQPNGELYVMDADGSNVVRLTNNDSTEANPAWSPDGSRIAFTRAVEPCYYGCPDDIFVMNADGSNVRRLATGWEFYQYHSDPSWSPNGTSIAFTRQYCDYYSCDDPSVWVVDVAGSSLGQIAVDAANPTWKP